ncbi:MAG: FKBP-type peptidyl-prolyl cis-trans isomerase [Burkholderiales bacterium]|nr:FKBP-type peptidyl-prolyl cis-trans isomerase [Phycisphaerae bacterium]
MVAYQFTNSAEPGAAPAAGTPAGAPTTQPFGDQYKTASYGIGYDLGKNIKQSKINLDPKLIAQGMEEGFSGAESKVSPEQFQAAMTNIQKEMFVNMEADQKVAGQEYLAENGKKPGVVTTASGLQIETVKEGTGAKPSASSTVKVHYTGTLTDGTKFDSSVDRGQPAEFEVGGVIAGWTEALQTMKVGGKSRLVIPSSLAYKEVGAPPRIPPNATLVFDVERLEITKPGAPSPQPAR